MTTPLTAGAMETTAVSNSFEVRSTPTRAPSHADAATQLVAVELFPKMSAVEEESLAGAPEAASEAVIKVPPSSAPLDLLDKELAKLTAMLNDKNCDSRLLVDQFCRIAMVIHRQGAIENKRYALDKEQELAVEITKVKKTYNNWSTVTITVMAGGGTILGGVVGLAGAASSIGPVVSFFGTAAVGTVLHAAGKGMGAVAQGSGQFSSIFKEKSEAERAVLQFLMNQGQNKLGETNQTATSEKQLSREAINKAAQIQSEWAQTIRLLLDTK